MFLSVWRGSKIFLSSERASNRHHVSIRWEKTTQMVCLQPARDDGTTTQLAVGKSFNRDLNRDAQWNELMSSDA